MRLGAVLLAGILVFALTPLSASGQGLPGLGLPSLDGWLGSGSPIAMSDPGQTGPGGRFAFDIGYMVNRNAVFDLSAQDTFSAGDLEFIRRHYPLQGLWLGGSAVMPVNERLSVYARGSWLVPANGEAPSIYGLFPDPDGLRTWRSRVQWYTLEAGAKLSLAASLAAIGGFRFDSFDTNFNSPSFPPLNLAGFADDRADVSVTSYIPYVGLVAIPGSSLKVGFVGFPYVPGRIKGAETYGQVGGAGRDEYSGSFRNAYFFEAFGEFGQTIMGGYVGVFGKWTVLHTKADVNLSFTQPGFFFPATKYDVTVDRQNWILGGKVAIQFSTPM